MSEQRVLGRRLLDEHVEGGARDLAGIERTPQRLLVDQPTWRASASIRLMACSAVVIELPNGVFITITPLAVAAGMSTLSTPMPARPITLRFFALSRSFAVTLVAERMARPSKPPTRLASFS